MYSPAKDVTYHDIKRDSLNSFSVSMRSRIEKIRIGANRLLVIALAENPFGEPTKGS